MNYTKQEIFERFPELRSQVEKFIKENYVFEFHHDGVVEGNGFVTLKKYCKFLGFRYKTDALLYTVTEWKSETTIEENYHKALDFLIEKWLWREGYPVSCMTAFFQYKYNVRQKKRPTNVTTW